MDLLVSFITSFVTLFVIMDPFASLPAFIALTKNFNDSQRMKAANKAVLIAGILAVIFLFAGTAFLEILGISLGSFRVAGGILLALLGLETVLGFSFNHGEKKQDLNAVAVLIATPLLTGPGLLSSLILLSSQFGYWIPLGAVVAALTLSWLILHYSHLLKRVLGNQIIDISSKVMGLLLVGIGIEFIRGGLLA
ncbi:MarC family protein [Candidatus Micrarchaeota archaeon]|nr:MarC family protein [Candidatus Micrarchaeota archaeon]